MLQVDEEVDTSLEILELEMISDQELMCAGCSKKKAEWWCSHAPGKSCRTPICGSCRIMIMKLFVEAMLGWREVFCSQCNSDKLHYRDLYWERMT